VKTKAVAGPLKVEAGDSGFVSRSYAPRVIKHAGGRVAYVMGLEQEGMTKELAAATAQLFATSPRLFSALDQLRSAITEEWSGDLLKEALLEARDALMQAVETP
jgi:hypothetical protein